MMNNYFPALEAGAGLNGTSLNTEEGTLSKD
jgi:hypothetical protein